MSIQINAPAAHGLFRFFTLLAMRKMEIIPVKSRVEKAEQEAWVEALPTAKRFYAFLKFMEQKKNVPSKAKPDNKILFGLKLRLKFGKLIAQ